MTRSKRVLIISTSADRLEDGTETGLWLSELTTPYYDLKDAGIEVAVASVSGGTIPIDKRSLEVSAALEPSVQRYEQDQELQAILRDAPSFDEFDREFVDAIFFPGGHGAMMDYPGSTPLWQLVSGWLAADKPLAAVCHGPAVLANAVDAEGRTLIAGRVVAGFSDTEEDATGLAASIPFTLEDLLRNLGADYRSGPDFQPFAIRDRNLITGQNPASAMPVARLLIDLLLQADAQKDLIILDSENDLAAMAE